MQANGRGPLALFQLALAPAPAPAPAPAILPLYGQTCMTALARVLACKPYVVYGMVWYGLWWVPVNVRVKPVSQAGPFCMHVSAILFNFYII